MSRFFVLAAVVAASIVVSGCGSRGTSNTGNAGNASATDKATPSYAFITNGVADFWEHAEAGAEAPAKSSAST